MRAIRFLMILLVCAGGFSSCTHPVNPPSAVTIPDSVTIAGPKVGYVKDSVTFTAHVNFTSSVPILYKWVFEDSTFIQNDSNKARIFQDSGKQIFSVQVLRRVDSSVLCSARDTILILDTTHHDTVVKPPPPDTTSHNFTWTQFLDVGNENNMTGCWVFGPNCILANNSYMYEWNGSTWQRQNLYSPDPQIGKTINGSLSGFSIFGFDTSDYWLTDADIIFHYTGNGIAPTYREENVIVGSAKWLHSAWGTSSSDMYFVGDYGTVVHFDGTNWTKMNSGTTTDLNSIWGTADGNIWACGTNAQNPNLTVLLHYNGTSWSIDPESSIPTSQSGGFLSVWACDSATAHQIAWTSGTTIYHKSDNGPWMRDSEALTLDLSGFFVTGSTPNNLFAVGTGGDIIHWNGLTWEQYNQYYSPSDPNYFPHQISMNGGMICIAGYKDGQGWILVGQQQ